MDSKGIAKDYESEAQFSPCSVRSLNVAFFYQKKFMNQMDPISRFQSWYEQELEVADVLVPSACCLSSIGADGYPNARFVALKEISDDRFIVTGPLDSRKYQELTYTPRAALTFWWPATGKQVRVQGDMREITPEDADRYFRERTRESQILTWVSKQGAPVENDGTLEQRFDHFTESYAGKEIPRPKNWGGIGISPIRVEFLTFDPERFHKRLLYVRSGSGWNEQYLQP